MIGGNGGGRSLRTFRRSSRPSIPGITTSRRTRLGRSSRIRRNASSPFEATVTKYSSRGPASPTRVRRRCRPRLECVRQVRACDRFSQRPRRRIGGRRRDPWLNVRAVDLSILDMRTVSVLVARPAVAALGERGIDAESVLRAAGLSRALLDDIDSRLPAESVYVFSASATVGESFKRFTQYVRLLSDRGTGVRSRATLRPAQTRHNPVAPIGRRYGSPFATRATMTTASSGGYFAVQRFSQRATWRSRFRSRFWIVLTCAPIRDCSQY
jgi:hypothetical protein